MRKFVLLTLVAVLATGVCAAKELRIAYVDSDKILESNEDYRQAKQKLQEEERQYIAQATAMEEALKQMDEENRAQSLMLSDSARAERKARAMDVRDKLDKFRRETWGEGGKLYTRNIELSKPVLDKINTAIQKVSQEAGYDYVFDAASSNIVFALPDYDITDRVLEQLKKE
jgi:outer membrane protein